MKKQLIYFSIIILLFIGIIGSISAFDEKVAYVCYASSDNKVFVLCQGDEKNININLPTIPPSGGGGSGCSLTCPVPETLNYPKCICESKVVISPKIFKVDYLLIILIALAMFFIFLIFWKRRKDEEKKRRDDK